MPFIVGKEQAKSMTRAFRLAFHQRVNMSTILGGPSVQNTINQNKLVTIVFFVSDSKNPSFVLRPQKLDQTKLVLFHIYVQILFRAWPAE